MMIEKTHRMVYSNELSEITLRPFRAAGAHHDLQQKKPGVYIIFTLLRLPKRQSLSPGAYVVEMGIKLHIIKLTCPFQMSLQVKTGPK
jgi:hypothetical protein